MNRREAILEATLNLVAERGLYDTPMSEVAREAEVAAGTIYHYFNSKESLIMELYKDIRSRLGQALMKRYDNRSPYQEQFARFWRNLFTFFITHPLQFRFLEQFDNSPYYNSISNEEKEKYFLPLLKFIERGLDEEIFRKMESQLMMSILYGSISAVAKSHIRGELSIDSSKLYKSIGVSWRGLAN